MSRRNEGERARLFRDVNGSGRSRVLALLVVGVVAAGVMACGGGTTNGDVAGGGLPQVLQVLQVLHQQEQAASLWADRGAAVDRPSGARVVVCRTPVLAAARAVVFRMPVPMS